MRIFTIIVTYNGAHWVDRCFASLMSADAPCTVLVVDNGSTDGTVERIRAGFPSVEVYRAHANLGFGKANNVAIRMALDRSATHFFLLNQDAWVVPGSLAALATELDKDPSFGIVSPMHLNGSGDALDVFFSRSLIPAQCPGYLSDLVLGKVKTGIYATTNVNAAAWLMSRACVERVGGFSPVFYHYGEDENYVNRLHYHGSRIGVLPGTYVHHDREDRPESSYFTDRMEYDRRIFVRNLSDPADERTGSEELAVLARARYKALLVRRSSELKRSDARKQSLLRANRQQVMELRARTRVPGPTFLGEEEDLLGAVIRV
ncbi:MAG: glycosyltransferase family 2 protein [Flavobacteriales bacterium]|nr:glycosyltransferase family 2 protein [Flavobacteriales bacterium]